MVFRKRLADCSCERKQNKRKRLAFNCSDASSIYNEIGIMYLQRQEFEEAEKNFSKAFFNESSTEKISITDDFFRNENNETVSYNHDSQEYDEGLYNYSNVLSINELMSPELRSATILFNLGQSCIVNKKYVEGRSWLEMALEIILYCQSTNNDACVVDVFKVLHVLGYCCYRLGQMQTAMQYYQRALVQVELLSLGELDLAVSCNCVAVLLFHNHPSRLSEALELFQMSLFIFRQKLGDNTKEVGTVLNNIGRVYYSQAKLDQALEAYEESLRIRRQTLGISIDMAVTVFNIGYTFHEHGKLDLAMNFYKEFVDISVNLEGSNNNRNVITAYNCMGKAQLELGNFQKSRSLFYLALQKQPTNGYYHDELCASLDGLGSVTYKMKNKIEALNYFKESLAVERRVEKPNVSRIANTLINIGHIHELSKDYDEAFVAYKEAHTSQIGIDGPSSPQVASILSRMGLMKYLSKDFASSLEFYQGSLQTLRDCLESDIHLDIASALNSVGLVLHKLEEYSFANEVFKESLRIRQALLGESHQDVARVWFNIGTVYLDIGDEEHAIQSLQESLKIERETIGTNHFETVTTLQQLGQIHQQRGEFDEALQYYAEALSIEKQRKESDPVLIRKLLNMIGNIHLMVADVKEMMQSYVEASRVASEEPEQEWNSLVIIGIQLYGISKHHPACASAA